MITETKKTKEEIVNNIKQIILLEIAPMLNQDGGDIELVDFEDGVAKVKLQGACLGCPMADFTMKNMVEIILKDNVPEVQKVEQIRDEIITENNTETQV